MARLLFLLPGERLDKLEASDSFHIDNVDTEYRHLKAGRVEFPNLLKELTQEEMAACIHTCDPASNIVELCSLLPLYFKQRQLVIAATDTTRVLSPVSA